MDHLQIPKVPSFPRQRVPLVCQPYDGGDFLSYPARAGWPHAVQGEYKYAFSQHELNHPSDDRVLEAFFQCWLFFGLLHEIGAKQEDFIEDGYVHTRNLVLPKKPEISLLKCLERTEEILLSIHVSRETGDRRPGFNPAIRMSIVSLYGELASLAELHYEWTAKDGMFAAVEVEPMLKHGWCPATVARELAPASAVAFKYYIQHLKMPDERDHSACTDVCKHATMGPGYQLAHLCDRCNMIGPDVKVVENILSRGTYPVIKVDPFIEGERDAREATSNVEVVPVEEHAYVAISHVWAEGLGNSSDLTLPLCQIRELGRLVKALEGRTFRHDGQYMIEERQLHLWIDSLLVPHNPKSHQQAMSHMRDVYKNSTYVLALDRALQRIRYGDPIEAMTRLHVSQWAGRLWTLQEAALPATLLIQFQDQAVDFYEIQKAMLEVYENDLTRRRLCSHLMSKSGMLRSARSQMPDNQTLVLLYAAMSYRKVSYEKDKPVCAAALLNLDISRVSSKGTLEERMVEFWVLLSQSKFQIPSSLVFNRVPRLTIPGFRWAPATIAEETGLSDLTLLTVGGEKSARLTSNGLEVHHSCWQVRPLQRGRSLQMLVPSIWPKPTNELYIRSDAGEWYFAHHNEDLMEEDTAAGNISNFNKNLSWELLNRHSTWHIMREEHKIQQGRTQRSLIGQVDHGVFTAATDIVIRPYLPAHKLLAEAAYQHALEVLHSRHQWTLNILTWCSGLITSKHLARWQEQCRAEIVKNFDRRKKMIQPPEIQAAMQSLQHDGADPQSFFGSHMLHSYLGRMMRVEKSWGPDTTWCVD